MHVLAGKLRGNNKMLCLFDAQLRSHEPAAMKWKMMAALTCECILIQSQIVEDFSDEWGFVTNVWKWALCQETEKRQKLSRKPNESSYQVQGRESHFTNYVLLFWRLVDNLCIFVSSRAPAVKSDTHDNL